jgi:hypothetical protein
VLEELGKPEQEPEERSPTKKRSGSSKSFTKHSNTNKASPPKVTATSTVKKIPFEDTYVHPHKRVILDLAIHLKSKKAFKEFTKALMTFIENAQMVDPKFVINTLNPKSKEKNITTKGKISYNMTKLGTQVKISSSSNAFNKQKVWDNEEQSNKGRNNQRSNKGRVP